LNQRNKKVLSAKNAQKDLTKYASAKKAKVLARFFKTGVGEYGEGDVFLGIMVPQTRILAKQYAELVLKEVTQLLKSPIHEERLLALFILIAQFEKGTEKQRENIFKFYLANTKYINNWDLVDLSAPKIVGAYLEDKNRIILKKLAQSKDIWKRRIAILATFQFIKNNDFNDALAITTLLIHDEHDLIQKAVGWMLREIGKRDQAVEERFLRKWHKTMPRTMLRYAIERFPQKLRRFYMFW